MLYNPHKRIIPCINTVKCSDRDRECSLLYKKQTSPKLKKPRFRKKNRGFLYPVYSLKLAVFILFIALLSLYSAISRAR